MKNKPRKHSISSKSRKITDLAQVSTATRGLLITNKEKYSEEKVVKHHNTFLEGAVELL